MNCGIDTNKAFGASEKELNKAKKELDSARLEDKGRMMADTELNVVLALNAMGFAVNGNKVDVVAADGVRVKYLRKDTPTEVDSERDVVTVGGKRYDDGMLNKFYSDMDFITATEGDFEEMALGIHNDPKKILSLAKEINELAPEADSVHASRLMKVLSRASNEVHGALPEINVMLNKEASRNQGIVKISEEWNAATIEISVGPGKSNMSPLEVYTHEVLHTAVEFALSRKDAAGAAVRNLVQGIRKEFLNNKNTLKWLTEELGNEADAINMMKYLAGIGKNGEVDNSRGIKEFVVYSQTNKAVVNVIKKMNTTAKDQKEFRSFAEKIAYMVTKVLGLLRAKITGIPNSNDYDRMVTLVDKLMQSNNNALEVKRQKMSGKILSGLHAVNGGIHDAANRVLSKYDKPYIAQGKQLQPGIHSIMYGIKLGGKALISETARKQFSIYLATLSGGIVDEKSMLQSTVQEMMENDDAENNASSLSQQRGNLDRVRNNEKAITERVILEAFDGEITDKEKRILNIVLDTDMNSVLGDPNIDTESLLRDETKLDDATKTLMNELMDEGKLNEGDVAYFNEQIRVLVNNMLEGTPDITLISNAYGIANMVNDESRAFKVERSDGFVDKLDKLITLEALKRQKQEDRLAINDMLENRKVGIATFIEYVNYNTTYADEVLYGKDAKLMSAKGYRTDNLDKNIDIKLAKMSDRAILEKQGYKLVRQGINKAEWDTSGDMGYFVSTVPTRTRWHTGATAMYSGKRDRGVSVKQIHYAQGEKLAKTKGNKDVMAMKGAMAEKLAAVRKGTFDAGNNAKYEKVSPRYNEEGKIVDFVYDMNIADKKLHLGANRDPIVTVGEVRGANWSEVNVPKHNMKVTAFIERLQKSNVQMGLRGKSMAMGADGKRYLWVGEDSADKELKNLWRMLPKHFREKFVHNGENGEVVKGFFVRADLQHELMGYTEFALSDTRFVKKIAGSEHRHAMKVAGMLWKSVIAIYKGKILLRVPEVLFSNTFSNIMFSIMYLKNPLKVAKYQLNGVKALNDYVRMVQEQVKLETKHVALKKKLADAKNEDKASVQKELDLLTIKMEQNKGDIVNSDIAPLVDEGFYTQIIEEMEVGEGNNIVEDYFSNKLEKVPSIVRNGLDHIWLSDKHAIVKFMQTSTQFSDFVARYAHYNLMIESGAKGRDAIHQVRSMFVNYNKPSSPVVEWANQMGAVMFTKYFSRIQKAIVHLVKVNPAGFAAAMLGQELAGDVADPTDAHLFSKDIDSLFYNPIESAIGAATPGLYLFVKDLM